MDISYSQPNIFLYSLLPTMLYWNSLPYFIVSLISQSVVLESAASPGSLLEMQSLAPSQSSWIGIFVLMRSSVD